MEGIKVKCKISCPFAQIRCRSDKMEIICRQLLTKGMSSDWIIGEYEPFQELDVECKLAPEEFVAAAEREIVWINLLINQVKAEMGQEQEAVSDVLR